VDTTRKFKAYEYVAVEVRIGIVRWCWPQVLDAMIHFCVMHERGELSYSDPHDWTHVRRKFHNITQPRDHFNPSVVVVVVVVQLRCFLDRTRAYLRIKGRFIPVLN
jgi:hypothetical protein